MSYVDTLTEFEEFRAWEDGRLHGLKYALDLIQNTEMKSGFARLIRDMRKGVALAVHEQQKFLDEAYGDVEE
tara:strand:- start:152 stop:367 length:216 start_codon:yes stop_codon:yes gene_type:complete